MSEVNPTPEDLVEQITLTVEDATVIPSPIDPTLSNEGEAADAAATGAAIAAVLTGATVNGKSPTGKAFTIYAGDIAMSSSAGAQTVAEAIASAADKDAADIMYDTENLVTVKGAIDAINTALESELTTEEIDGIFDEVFEGDE